MMNFIGQKSLLNTVDNYTLDSMPRTILLEGLKGSGKHSIVNRIASNLNLEVKDISTSINMETIDEINSSTVPFIYIIDTQMLTLKNENVILKFLEEPLKNAYIFLLCENQYNLINTIRNRCILLKLSSYSKDELSNFLDKSNPEYDTILNLSQTPGDVKEFQESPTSAMIDFANKIFDNIHNAGYANSLKISDRVALKNEKDKFDFNLFFRILVYVSHKRVLNNIEGCLDDYKITQKYMNMSKVKNVDKKYLFDNYIFALKDRL